MKNECVIPFPSHDGYHSWLKYPYLGHRPHTNFYKHTSVYKREQAFGINADLQAIITKNVTYKMMEVVRIVHDLTYTITYGR